ncbi:ABC transporter substrate-binding protein [Streptomyces sp. NPDC048603]|uniref:ABC transporter substrate-binding protein n=1 Tax=Streptomyces sp. NPDC048603 TaxID=3365577 RepID=UPI00371D7B1E
MRRRFFGAAATSAALGLLFSLSGCGSSSGDGDDATLKLVAAEYGTTPQTSSKTFWDKATDEFTAQHPGIKVEVKLLPWAEIDREVSRMVKAGKAPDMALMGSYSDFAAEGKIYPADELLSVRAEANFLQPLAEAGSIGNTLYGLPFVASSRLLFYNETLFNKAKVTPPKNWKDLKEAAQALKKEGVRYPYALPLGPEEAHAEALIWELSNGGGYVDTSGNYALSSEANVETFQWIKTNLVSPGLVGPVQPGKFNRQDAFSAFLRGEVGMLNGYPSLYQEAKAKGIAVKTMPMPVNEGLGPAETPPAVGVADWMVAFNQNEHKQQIGKFLDFIYQDKYLSEFAGQYHLLPSTVTATRASSGNGTGIEATDQAFLAALRGAQLYPVNNPNWVTVSDTIKRNIGRAVEPAADPKAVLEDIANKSRNESKKS